MQSMQNAQNSFWNNASLFQIRDRSSRQWISGEPTFTAPTYRHLLADMWEISDVTEFNNFVQNKLPLYQKTLDLGKQLHIQMLIWFLKQEKIIILN
ncbi:hypothetical protein NW739_00200 [Mycoplasmopsis felis]|uniref:hypothetical protein n=1 Tax=Mycoplasmopsis felis TaxID=33923 RepID=UPI0021DFADCA|nr:hypothetical protein [Mycoplasmopsis felis]MCU9939270.1 hypothetical protein [Mycoplasmopsis felis]